MASQKPGGRTSGRRVGLPKAPALDSVRPVEDHASRDELPTDFAALANILEAAMLSDPLLSQGQGGRQLEIPNPNGQGTNPDAEFIAPQRAGAVIETSQSDAAAFDAVAQSLAAAEACVPLLAQSTGLLRMAALDVVRAETARAGGLLQILRFLRGDVSPAVTAVSTSAVVQRVTQALDSERRLRSIALTTRSSVADATCAGDETLLTNTLLALLLTTFALLEGVQNARVTLAVTVNSDGEIGFAVSQDHVTAPANWAAGAAAGDGPAENGRAITAVAFAGARRLASEWRGRLAIAAGEHSTILTLWLPAIGPGESEPLPH